MGTCALADLSGIDCLPSDLKLVGSASAPVHSKAWVPFIGKVVNLSRRWIPLGGSRSQHPRHATVSRMLAAKARKALLALAGSFGYALQGTVWARGEGSGYPATTIKGLGDLLLSKYLLPFEVVSILLLAVLSSAEARAQGAASRVELVELVPAGGASGAGSPGLAGWMRELRRRTNTAVSGVTRRIGPDSPLLFRYPLLVSRADGAVADLPAASVGRLRRHLALGGTWVIDGPATSTAPPAFLASVRRVAAQLFPDAKLQPLPADHTVWKSFYLLAPEMFDRESLAVHAVIRDRRAVLVTTSGLLAATAGTRDDLPGEWLRRLAVNLAMYALCVDYKSDQVHAPAILNRRRLLGP